MSSYTHSGAGSSGLTDQQRKAEQRRQQLALLSREFGRETTEIRQQLEQLQGQLVAQDARAAQRLDEQIRWQQQRLGELEGRLHQRQAEYEAATQEHLQQIAKQRADDRQATQAQLAEMRRCAEQGLAEVRSDMARTEAQLKTELQATQAYAQQTRAELGARIEHTREELRQEVDGVRQALAQDQAQRRDDEAGRHRSAETILQAVRARMPPATEQTRLDLAIEWTRVEQQAGRAGELLQAGQATAALAAAHSASAALETSVVEQLRRNGRIDGAVAHAREVVSQLEAVRSESTFAAIFPVEASAMAETAEKLRQQARTWDDERRWIDFEANHGVILTRANQALVEAHERAALTPEVSQQLRDREQRMWSVAQDVVKRLGSADRVERTYTTADPKGPKRVAMHYGLVRVDLYFELDGQVRSDVYGCSSPTDCARITQALTEVHRQNGHVIESHVDAIDPRRPHVQTARAPAGTTAQAPSASRAAPALRSPEGG